MHEVTSGKVQFQQRATNQGAQFEGVCITALQMAGFEIADRKLKWRPAGTEIDIVATNQRGVSLAIECTGSWHPTRPGMRREDTVLKKIASGYLLSQSPDYRAHFPPLIVMTSHIPKRGACLAQLRGVETKVLADVFTPDDGERLMWWATRTAEEIQAYVRDHDHLTDAVHLGGLSARHVAFEFKPPMK